MIIILFFNKEKIILKLNNKIYYWYNVKEILRGGRNMIIVKF